MPSDSQRRAPLILTPHDEHQNQQDDAEQVKRDGEAHQLLWRQLRDEPHDATMPTPMFISCPEARLLA